LFIMFKKLLIGIIGIIVISGALSAMGDDKSSPTTSAPAITSNAQSDKPQEPAKPSVKTYKAGMYKVGTDMPSGEFVLIGSGSVSYFEVDKDSTGQLDSILANDNFSKRSIISIADGQYLKMTGCTAYAFNDAPSVRPTDGFLLEGMYKVGVDLPAGEHKISGDGGMSYVEVSNDSSHGMGSIISNDNFSGETYITVKDGQYLKLNGAKIKVQ